jgi:glycosyltransferase involved in cell wall biosynthesis
VSRHSREQRRLSIALVAPPFVAVPPVRYGGTERVVAALADELVRRGHAVTLFAAGGSRTAAELQATLPRPAWDDAAGTPTAVAMQRVIDTVVSVAARRAFDIVHAHVELDAIRLAAHLPNLPVVATFHLPVDRKGRGQAIARATTGNGTRSAPFSPVALSRSQAAAAPEVRWSIVPNGLPLATIPFVAEVPAGGELAYVGRTDPEKGLLEAIEIASLAGRRLRVAARVGDLPEQRAHFENVVRPALRRADVEFLGELTDAERDGLLGASAATLVTPRWPEPFGLVAIESLAAGTPVLAIGAGALPEIVRDGVDGAIADTPGGLAARLDDVLRLDRAALRRDVLSRFSVARMADGYEAVYADALDERRQPPRSRPAPLRRRTFLRTAETAGDPVTTTRAGRAEVIA